MPPKKRQQDKIEKPQEKEEVSEIPKTQTKKNQKQQKMAEKTLQVVNDQEPIVQKNGRKLKTELGDGKFTKQEISIASWNINGVRAILKKNDLTNYFTSGLNDIICLNELKIDEDTFIKEKIANKFPNDYFLYFNYSRPPKTGYSGVSIFSKVKPISVQFDLNIPKHDGEGRTITLEFEKFYLVSCYVPNAGQKLERLKYRTQVLLKNYNFQKEWDVDFRNFLNDLKSRKPTILCGDLNVAHNEIDIANPKGNERSAGFTREERAEFSNLLNDGWVDSFRRLHPTEQKFSYFSARSNARASNKGWRLDYFVIDTPHQEAITQSEINNTIFGSDHTPIEIKLDLSRL